MTISSLDCRIEVKVRRGHMEKQTMGAFICALRKSKGITQKELAGLLNVSDKAVSRWECDQTVPDISLLPLIADIFEVTTDELIRGARIKREYPTDNQEKNIQKRLEILLENKLSSYKTRSIVSVVLVVVGIIIGFVCKIMNGFHEIGIGISFVLFAIALACQIIFFLNFKNSINTSELNTDTILLYKLRNFDFSFGIFTLLLCVQSLIFSVHWNWFWWYGPVLAIAILLLSVFVKSIVIRKTTLPISDARRQREKLNFKTLGIFICVVGVLASSMVLVNAYCYEWFEKPEVFYVTDSTGEIENYVRDNLSQFMDIDDVEIKVTIDGSDISISDDIDNEELINKYVINQVEKDGKEVTCVKLWTTATRIDARGKLDNINIAYIILYIICIIIALGIYISKLTKIKSHR